MRSPPSLIYLCLSYTALGMAVYELTQHSMLRPRIQDRVPSTVAGTPPPPTSRKDRHLMGKGDTLPVRYRRIPSWISLYSFRFFWRLVTSCWTTPNVRASQGNTTVSDTQAVKR